MKIGSAIINTTSVTAYRGSASLIDYSSTKGAIVSFTRSLAHAVVKRAEDSRECRRTWADLDAVDSRAFRREGVEISAPMRRGRAGQPNEVAPCYVFLASDDSSYFTGQVLHPNGGEIVNG